MKAEWFGRRPLACVSVVSVVSFVEDGGGRAGDGVEAAQSGAHAYWQSWGKIGTYRDAGDIHPSRTPTASNADDAGPEPALTSGAPRSSWARGTLSGLGAVSMCERQGFAARLPSLARMLLKGQ